MTLRGRTTALVAAVLTAFALAVAMAMPDVATANEAPSPPALGALAHCHAGQRSAITSIDGCPAIVRASSSGTLPTGRRLPVGVTTPTAAVSMAGPTTDVAGDLDRTDRPSPTRSNGARAPPLPAI